MKRWITCLLIGVLLAQSGLLAAVSVEGKSWSYEPYRLDEFPRWSIKLRRAETIMFGSLPLTFALSGAAYSLARGFGAAPLGETDLNEALALGAIAISLSGIIAFVDFILGEALQ